jgi:hypothetical protein
MKSFTPGGIRSPEAYAQGKMLDHSWWSGQMRGRITPSDLDMFVESHGCFLFCELSRSSSTLADMSTGQRIAMERFAKLPGIHAVCILRHGMFSHSRAIDTANDIESAAIYFDGGSSVKMLDGEQWRGFACQWTHNPKAAIDTWLRGGINNE